MAADARPMEAPRSMIRPGAWVGALVSLAALVLCALAGGAAWRAWLAAAFLCISAPVGALGLVMMMRLIPGAWARQAAPFLEAEATLIPLGAVALAPILFALGQVYGWFGERQATAFRAVWFSAPAFITVFVVWVAVLATLAMRLLRRPDAPPALSCIGLLLFTVLGTFAAANWIQSIDPDFRSSGFPLYVIGLQMLVGLCGALVLALTGPAPLSRQGVLGGLLLTLLLIWAYLAYMPFFISWSGNVAPAAVWYLKRDRGVWVPLTWLIAATRFVPMFLLLFRAVRNRRGPLLAMAAIVLAGSVPEMAWLVLPAAPAAPPATLSTAALFLLATAGLAGLAWAWLRPALDWVEAER